MSKNNDFDDFSFDDFSFDDFSFDDNTENNSSFDDFSEMNSMQDNNSSFDDALDEFSNSNLSSNNDYTFEDNNNINNEQQENNIQFNTDIQQDDDSKAKLKKTALIMIAVGVGALAIVMIIGSLVTKKSTKTVDTSVVTVVDDNAYQKTQQTQQNNNVTQIITNGNPESPSSTSVVTNTNTQSNNGWTEISDDQQIIFNSEYTTLTFTVTGIKHLAHKTDNNLHVKTIVSGSLSGLSGTYEVELPYNKGILLNVGNEFAVNVLLGSYNEKTVVGDIKY